MITTQETLTEKNKEVDTYIRGKRYIYSKGYKDFLVGQLSSPYRSGTILDKEWQRGQNAAYFENLRRLNNGQLNMFKKKIKRAVEKPKLKLAIQSA